MVTCDNDYNDGYNDVAEDGNDNDDGNNDD